MITKTKSWFDVSNPHLLRNILLLGFFVRFISVLFAKGFGMHDDHFLVIEAAQSWADGTDYNNWLPSSGATQPSGHSFLYSGINFILLVFLKFIHLNDPQAKMLIIRLLHALLSLVTIICGFKIAENLAGKKAARTTGILLAVYWFMPWLSVRNLVEVVCIPLLMWGSWIYLKAITDHQKPYHFLIAGIILGFSLSLRYQVFSYVIGFGFGMLLLKQWKPLFLLGIGTILSFVAVQGIIDQCIWGYPFAEFAEYIRYNIDNAYNYIVNPWYSYILLMLGILIPPLSFFLFFGFFKGYKLQLALFTGALLFIVFHSYFPNKQERFILPVVPMFITLGICGWSGFVNNSSFWNKHKKLLTSCFIFFWAINLAVLPFVSTMYSKKARVESMTYLSKYPDIKILLMEDIYHGTPKMPPEFYLGQWITEYDVAQDYPFDTLKNRLDHSNKSIYPRFVLFFEDRDIEQRVKKIKEITPNIEYETTIKPGFIDDLMYRLNPKNANQTIVIYRNKDFFPNKID
jgi:hypothetical protein